MRAVWPAFASVGLCVGLLVASFTGNATGQLTLISQLRFDDNENGVSGFITAISQGETVFVLDFVPPEQGVHVFDVSQPDAPSRISHFPLEESDPSDYLSTSLAIANDKLLIQTTERGLLVVNASQMGKLKSASWLASPGPEWWGSEVVASEGQVLAFYWHEGRDRFEGFIRQSGMNVDGTLDPIQDYSLEGRPVEAAVGHGKLYVILWKAMREYSLTVWAWGRGELTFLDEVPLNETVRPAIQTSDRFVAVGFGDIAIFRPTAEGVELLDSENVPGGGIRALVWLDTEVVAVTHNGLWSHQVNPTSGELSAQTINRWIAGDDGATVQDALVVVTIQGLAVVGQEPAKESPLLALVALTAAAASGVALWIVVRRKLHGREGGD